MNVANNYILNNLILYNTFRNIFFIYTDYINSPHTWRNMYKERISIASKI